MTDSCVCVRACVRACVRVCVKTVSVCVTSRSTGCLQCILRSRGQLGVGGCMFISYHVCVVTTACYISMAVLGH